MEVVCRSAVLIVAKEFPALALTFAGVQAAAVGNVMMQILMFMLVYVYACIGIELVTKSHSVCCPPPRRESSCSPMTR